VNAENTVCWDKSCKYSLLRITVKIKWHHKFKFNVVSIYDNPFNAELNPICHLLALLGAHHILHVSRVRVNQFLLLRQSVDSVTDQCENDKIYKTSIFRSIVICLCSI